MDVESVKAYCASLSGASSKRFDEPSNILVYYAKGRKFAYFKTSEPEQWRFSVCTSSDRFVALTDMPGIKPARYLARFRWITIVDVNSLPENYLRELIDWSYNKAITPSRKKSHSKR